MDKRTHPAQDRAAAAGGHRVPFIKSMVRRRVPAHLRLRVHWWLVDTPGVSELWCATDPAMRIARITRTTKLVIDGFARSANSYARAAFLHANGTGAPISTHGHSPRFVELGVRRHIPVIVLIREPGGVLASAMQFDPTVPPGVVIDGYIRYYTRILPLLDDVLVVRFEEVTHDFGAVIRRCNERFGTDFASYEPTPAAEAAVAEHIEAGTGYAVAASRHDACLPLPTPGRSGVREALAPEVAKRLKVAAAVHAAVLRRSGRTR